MKIFKIKFCLPMMFTAVLAMGSLFVLNSPVRLAYAQNNNSALEGLQQSGGGLVPCGNTQDNPCTLVHVFRLAYNMINIMFGAAGVFAVFAIINGAFTLSETMGNEEKAAAGKKKISHALWGLMLVFISYLLVRSVMSFVGLGPDVLSNPVQFIISQ